jgi:hypothetical protein
MLRGRKNKNNNNKNRNNNKKRSKNNKSPKLCLGDLIRSGAKTISLQTFFGRLKYTNFIPWVVTVYPTADENLENCFLYNLNIFRKNVVVNRFK